jgi:hypothetical protein
MLKDRKYRTTWDATDAEVPGGEAILLAAPTTHIEVVGADPDRPTLVFGLDAIPIITHTTAGREVHVTTWVVEGLGGFQAFAAYQYRKVCATKCADPYLRGLHEEYVKYLECPLPNGVSDPVYGPEEGKDAVKLCCMFETDDEKMFAKLEDSLFDFRGTIVSRYQQMAQAHSKPMKRGKRRSRLMMR